MSQTSQMTSGGTATSRTRWLNGVEPVHTVRPASIRFALTIPSVMLALTLPVWPGREILQPVAIAGPSLTSARPPQ